MTGVSIAALSALTLLSATPYGKARQDSLENGRPLVVLIGADWCPHCRTMKTSVMPRLEKSGALKEVAFAEVDSDRQRGLARKLLSGSSIPQLVMYRRTVDGWRRSRLVGGQSAAAVERFIEVGVAEAVAARKADQKNAQKQKEKKVAAALDFKMRTLDGKEAHLGKYQGKVVLIVNVASECGLTPQYEKLQQLHEKYTEQGLAILGFPCNQFGEQEPGTAKQIQEFCTKNYGVTFDLFAKVEVNGDGACELYKHLTAQETQPEGAGKITWNFEKFVLGRDGKVAARFVPQTEPDDPQLIKLLESELAEK